MERARAAAAEAAAAALGAVNEALEAGAYTRFGFSST
jgi:hypothetical protein